MDVRRTRTLQEELDDARKQIEELNVYATEDWVVRSRIEETELFCELIENSGIDLQSIEGVLCVHLGMNIIRMQEAKHRIASGWYTREICEYTGMSAKTLNRYCEKCDIPVTKNGDKSRRYSVDELEQIRDEMKKSSHTRTQSHSYYLGKLLTKLDRW